MRPNSVSLRLGKQRREASMKLAQRFGLSVLSIVVAIALPAFAFEYPLSSTSIRAAYMLGSRNDDITSEFLARYKHSLPMPQTGPHVGEISVETPYTQVVEIGQTDRNKDIQGAEKEFAQSVSVHRARGSRPDRFLPRTSAQESDSARSANAGLSTGLPDTAGSRQKGNFRAIEASVFALFRCSFERLSDFRSDHRIAVWDGPARLV